MELNKLILISSATGLALVVHYFKTPKFIKIIFNNSMFRIVYLSFLFIFNFKDNPSMAIILSLLFLLTLYLINRDEMSENLEYVKAYHEIQKERRKIYQN